MAKTRRAVRKPTVEKILHDIIVMLPLAQQFKLWSMLTNNRRRPHNYFARVHDLHTSRLLDEAIQFGERETAKSNADKARAPTREKHQEKVIEMLADGKTCKELTLRRALRVDKKQLDRDVIKPLTARGFIEHIPRQGYRLRPDVLTDMLKYSQECAEASKYFRDHPEVFKHFRECWFGSTRQKTSH